MPARAQDVRGLEVCTAEKQMDRRTGCLQANIDSCRSSSIAMRAMRGRNSKPPAKELAAATNEITTLKASLAATQARMEKLEKAGAEKPEKPK